MNNIPCSKAELKRIWEESFLTSWQEIKGETREYLKYLINNAILSELEHFIGCGKYERNDKRKTYRNGYYERLIGTTLGEIPIRYPRLREGRFESKFIKKYSRRQKEVDYAVLSCFLLGGSTRKTKIVSDLFIELDISHSTVSKILSELDERANQFHQRKIDKPYRFLILDGLWIKVNDKFKREKVILFAMGITKDGKKEIIDFMLADGESEAAYSKLIDNLLRRGLNWESLELVIHDGSKGLRSALDLCLPYTDKQYCVFHKIQNISQKLKRITNRKAITRDAGNVYRYADSKYRAITNMRKFIQTWGQREPLAVRCFAHEFDKTLVYFDFDRSIHKSIRTTNYLERFLREIRRRTRPMGCFRNDKSVNRIVYALAYLYNNGEVPYEFTQHS